MKVLIVDDSPVVRERLVDLLSELTGVELVGQAEDGMQGFEQVVKLKPDVAIVDVSMPRRSGLDLLRYVSKNPDAPRVIILTNYPTPENRKKCFDLGADYFFDKSNEIEKVVDVLKDLQQGMRALRH